MTDSTANITCATGSTESDVRVGCVATTDDGAIGLAERLHLVDREFDGGAKVLWCDQRGDERQQIQAKDLG